MVRYRKPLVDPAEDRTTRPSGFTFDPPRTRDRMMEGLTDPGRDPQAQVSGLDGLLTALYDKLSNQLAGGQRTLEPALPSDEGMLPDDYRQQLPATDWFDPMMWAQADPVSAEGLDLSQIPSGGPVREGKGMDFFRSGEAPSNWTNRQNPLYQARARFAVAANRQIREMFQVSDSGSAGYYRQRDPSHDAPGGPSGNSDHYSAGAIDYFGTPEELTKLRNWLIDQPFVSFVRWQSESHYDHLHVSFDLGWVAANYWGNEMPKFTIAGADAERTATQMREQPAPDLPETAETETLEVPRIV